VRRATVALAASLSRLGSKVGLEGAFLLAGAALLAVGASYIHPAGPYLVTGGLAVMAGIALALPARSR
jgi:hypothetical protein